MTLSHRIAGFKWCSLFILPFLDAVIANVNSSKGDMAIVHPKIDSDANGALTHHELTGHAEAFRGFQADSAAQAIYKETDQNGDGKIDQEELKIDEDDEQSVHSQGLFKLADEDKDGFLNVTELAAYHHPVRHTSAMLELQVRKEIQELDRDKDGMVSLREFAKVDENMSMSSLRNDSFYSSVEQQFVFVDRNSDGKLDAAELKDLWVSGKHQDHDRAGVIMTTADKDSSGGISMEELRAAHDELVQNPIDRDFILWVRDNHGGEPPSARNQALVFLSSMLAFFGLIGFQRIHQQRRTKAPPAPSTSSTEQLCTNEASASP